MSDQSYNAATATATAHPSLALAKYWGKMSVGINVPATSSVGVTLGAMSTRTSVHVRRSVPHRTARTDGAGPEHGRNDTVVLDGREQDPERFQEFFQAVRDLLRRYEERQSLDALSAWQFTVESENTFPTGAGLASSAAPPPPPTTLRPHRRIRREPEDPPPRPPRRAGRALRLAAIPRLQRRALIR